MPYRHAAGDTTWHFADLRTLMAKATPALASGVQLKDRSDAVVLAAPSSYPASPST